jgi:hypothetical protein
MYTHSPKHHGEPLIEPRIVLLEIKGWWLCKSKFDGPPNSYPFHLECSAGCSAGCNFSDEALTKLEMKCRLCGSPVPEEIQGVYILHNWETQTK